MLLVPELSELGHVQKALSELSLAQLDISTMYNAQSKRGFSYENVPPEVRMQYYNRILECLAGITEHIGKSLAEAAAEYRVRKVYGLNDV